MKWINTELAHVYHKDDPEDIYKLILEITQDWSNLSKKIWTIVYTHEDENFRKKYRLYTGWLIHDGNRQWGLVSDYQVIYDLYGKFDDRNPWIPLQEMLHYIRSAEIYLAFLEKELKG